MQLLELSPGELGARARGVYVVDEDHRILAGPFAGVSDAIAWIDTTAAARTRNRPDQSIAREMAAARMGGNPAPRRAARMANLTAAALSAR